MTTEIKAKRKPKRKSKHYIDNEKFYTALVKYSTSVKEAKAGNKTKPMVSDYIGKCLWDIAENLSHLPHFQRYPYRQDLVSDAIINCLQYIDNFDPDKSSNPFAYFTQISYYAFLRRIEKEKKYLYAKYKSIENAEIFSTLSDHQAGDETHTGDQTFQYSESARGNMNDFVEKFEASIEKKKQKVKKA